MRKDFARMLYGAMKTNSRIFLITADLGYGILDDIRRDFPDRSMNIGSSEQLMIGAAIGLSYSGYIPVCYSITPFLLYRPFEFIRNYLSHEQVPVKLVGSGRDRDYDHDGFSHWAEEDKRIMSQLDVAVYKPSQLTDDIFEKFLLCEKPAYLNLCRF